MKNQNVPVRLSTRSGELDYSSMDENTLLELFALYDRLGYARELDQVAHVLRRRAERGELAIFDKPPSPIASEVPGCLKTWPLCLLWKHRPQ